MEVADEGKDLYYISDSCQNVIKWLIKRPIYDFSEKNLHFWTLNALTKAPMAIKNP